MQQIFFSREQVRYVVHVVIALTLFYMNFIQVRTIFMNVNAFCPKLFYLNLYAWCICSYMCTSTKKWYFYLSDSEITSRALDLAFIRYLSNKRTVMKVGYSSSARGCLANYFLSRCTPNLRTAHIVGVEGWRVLKFSFQVCLLNFLRHHYICLFICPPVRSFIAHSQLLTFPLGTGFF